MYDQTLQLSYLAFRWIFNPLLSGSLLVFLYFIPIFCNLNELKPTHKHKTVTIKQSLENKPICNAIFIMVAVQAD